MPAGPGTRRSVALLRLRGLDALVPRGARLARRYRARGRAQGQLARRRPLARARAPARRRAAALRPAPASGGLVHQGWRDTVDPLHASGHGGGILRENGTAPEPPIADADTQAVALRDCAPWRCCAATKLEGSRDGARRADRGALRAGDDGRRGRRSRGQGRGLTARLAAVGGRSCRPLRRARPTGFASRTFSPLRAAHAVRPAPAVCPHRLSPRHGVAVRLVAGLGRPARGRPGG